MRSIAIAVFIAFAAASTSLPAIAQARTVLVNTSKYKLDIEVHFGRYVKSETVRPSGRLTLPEGKSYLAVGAYDERNRQICTKLFHVNGESRITFAVTHDRKCEYSRSL